MASVGPVPGPVASYAVGHTQIATTGAILVDRTEGSHVLPGFVLERPIRIIGVNRQPPEDSGVWAARFEYRGACQYGRYIVTNPYFYEERIGIVVDENGSISCDRPVVQIVGGKRGRSWQLDEQLPVQVFRPVPMIAGFEEDATRWQLVYRGLSGKKLTLEYREFRGELDDYARPAETKTLTYDLGRAKTISFRGTDIEVMRATSRDITYRVVRDEGRAAYIQPMQGYEQRRTDDRDRDRERYESREDDREWERERVPRPSGGYDQRYQREQYEGTF